MMARKGQVRYVCADCGNKQFEHWAVMARRCKPRCTGCGGTFLNPDSDGANEQFVEAGTARAIKEKAPPHAGTDKDAQMMRGDREIPGAKP